MFSKFKEIKPSSITSNVFKMIGDGWMLISAGNTDGYGTMTANWGGMGFLWSRNVVFSFVRPERNTYLFLEKSLVFTLSFFDERYKRALDICGTSSGRDSDKVKESGLTPAFFNTSGVYFEEARLVMVCQKLYFHDLNTANIVDDEVAMNYKQNYHRMYIGEIAQCLVK